MYDRRLEISFREAETEGGGSVIELNDDTAGVKVTPDLAQRIADILDSRRDGEAVVKWNGREFVPGGDPYAARDTETAAPEMFMPETDGQSDIPVQHEGEYVLTTDGSKDFGEISPEISRYMRRQQGKIRLRIGEQDDKKGYGYGEKHIERSTRLKQLNNAGFSSARDFVQFVAQNYDSIYQSSGGALYLCRYGRKNTDMLLLVKLERSENDDFYDIKTGFITRKNYIKGEPLWEKSQSSIDSATAQSTQLPSSAISRLSTSQVSSEGAEESSAESEARLRAFTELLDQFIPVSTEGERFAVDPSTVPEGAKAKTDVATMLATLKSADDLDAALHEGIHQFALTLDEEQKQAWRDLTEAHKDRTFTGGRFDGKAYNFDLNTREGQEQFADLAIEFIRDKAENNQRISNRAKKILRQIKDFLRKVWDALVKTASVTPEIEDWFFKNTGIKKHVTPKPVNTQTQAALRSELYTADNPLAHLKEQAQQIAGSAEQARFITELDGLARLYPPETNPYRAPNGKPSNLSPTQWYLVRTPSFKQKYGNWEALAKREELLSRKPVSIIPNATLISNETKLKVIKDWENAISVDGYSTSLPKATIDKIRDHQGFSVISMLESLLPLFENAVFINEEKNRGQYVDGAGNIHKNKPNFESYKNDV